MPTLNWIGKEAVVKHHKEVPLRLLKPVPELSCGPADSGNLIVQGDNLHAIKALLSRYAGQVKCIYIDPPYNTGNEGWVYNDNVNSPEIRKWLGEVIGKEGETLDRHDRWLCMMYPRLALLRQFLRDDGAIFVSIDDNEVGSLRLLLDEIFGSGNCFAHSVWEKRKNRENRKAVSVRHDHVLCFARDANATAKQFRPLPMNAEALGRYRNIDDDPRGPWKSDPATAQAGHGTSSQFYILTAPNGKRHSLPSGRCWVYTDDVMQRHIVDGRIWFGGSGNNVPRIKAFLHEKERGLTPETILFAEDACTNEEAKNTLKEIFGGHAPFETPKPAELVVQFLRMCTTGDEIVLDSFSGSGTTGHAVLRQNADDGGNDRFILVELDSNIAQEVTAERVKRVATGYKNTKGNAIAGLGGGFQFCRPSVEPLFDAQGQIRKDVTFAQLAEFVWFAETGSGYCGPTKGPLLGTHDGKAIYLLYNGILKDKSITGGNVLTGAVFHVLPDFDGPKVIYAAANRMGARTARADITFKQTPYVLEL